jgi:DNA-binding CsgD family transcriptional regulator
MSNKVMLLRTTRKIISYLEHQVTKEEHHTLEDIFPLLQTIQQMFPQWVVQTCIYQHPYIRFISANCHAVFGYTAKYLLAENYPLVLFSYIHEKDTEDLHRCFLFMADFIKEKTPEQCMALRFVFNYRIKHANGTYITLHDERATLRINDALALNYSLFKDMGNKAVFEGVKVEIYAQAETLEKLAEYKPYTERLRLSKRESEILKLIQQGLTNKEIAGHLNISPNTARNIRQKMFIRYGVTNIVELLNKTVYYN